jgi:hypothetical protein
MQVFVRQHPLSERREDDAAGALIRKDVEQLGLDPAVEHRVRGLVDQQRRPELAQDAGGLARLGGGVGRDPDVERLALPHRGVQSAHRLLERRVGVEPVRVEDVDVLEPHALEALFEARQQVLPRAPLPVGPGPHVVASLRRDDQLVPVGPEVEREHAPEVLLGRTVRRSVVVGEIEVGDPEVEGAPDDLAARLEGEVVAEVVPETERQLWQLKSAAAGPPVLHLLVAIGCWEVAHLKLQSLAGTVGVTRLPRAGPPAARP